MQVREAVGLKPTYLLKPNPKANPAGNAPAPEDGTKSMPTKITEEQFQQQIIDLARFNQYDVTYHNPDSRRSQAGFPDLVLISSSRRRALFRELKTQDGRVRPKQQAVLLAMVGAGLDADVWRPCDLQSGLILEQLRGEA
jgi:hypothetical protein